MADGDGLGMEALRLLEALEEDPALRQADLARRLGVAVGTVNWLLKRLAARGLIQVQRIGRWHWRYILTPRGMAEKARLVRSYVHSSMALYRTTRETAHRLLGQVRAAGFDRVRVEGPPDLADVCRLTCLEHGVAVVQDGEEELPLLRFDGYRLKLVLPPLLPSGGADETASPAAGEVPGEGLDGLPPEPTSRPEASGEAAVHGYPA